MKKFAILFTAVIVVATAQIALAQEGKELVIKTARALETSPSDKETRKMQKKAIRWIVETKEISVSLCHGVAGMIVDYENKYGEDMISAYTIGVAVFGIQNPSKSADRNATHLAGVELALKVYEKLVQEKPGTNNDMIDLLIEKRDKGELATTIALLKCGGK
jgi:hypothetical protein